MRGHLSVVLVVVALTACANAAVPTNAPRGGRPAVGASPPVQDPWAGLRARPLSQWRLAVGQRCPVSSVSRPDPTQFGSARGNGPVYPVGSDGPIAAGELWKILWVASPKYLGPVLIRGFRLDGDGYLLFDAANGNHSTQPEVAVPVPNPPGQWRVNPELDFQDAGTPSGAPWRAWPSYTYAPVSGCYAWDVEGNGFSETIVTEIA